MDALQHSFFSSLLLLGIIQGGIMTILLWNKSSNRLANRFLALAILAISLSLLRVWTHLVGIWWLPYGRRLPLAFELAIAPMLYLYALAISHAPLEEIRKKGIYLLIPWALFFIYALLVYGLSLPLDSFEAKDNLAVQWFFGPVKQVEDIITLLLNLILLYLMWRQIQRHNQIIQDWVSDKLAQRLKLIKIFSLTILVMAVLTSLDFVLRYFLAIGEEDFIFRQVFFLCSVLAIYILGFGGYNLPEVPNFQLSEAPPSSISNDNKELPSQQFQQLEALMENQFLYRNPALNLQDLAQELDLSSPATSQLIKQHSGKNFRPFINDYRLAEVQQKLFDKDYDHLSILAIAFDAGFNSEPSFYRYFKQATGQSPTAFRAKAKD